MLLLRSFGSLQPPGLDISLSQPLARLNQLNDIDDLLASHDGETDDSEDPWDGRVHLVGTGQLHGTS